MISQELELSLHACFVDARKKRYEFVTVECVLLFMLDNPSAKAVLMACSDNPNVIADLKKYLEEFITANAPVVVDNGKEVDSQPTLGFQRVLQRAIMHVDSHSDKGKPKREVKGSDILVALFGEKDSHAVYYLHKEGIIRLDVVSFLVHGIRKDGKPEEVPTGDKVPEKLAISSFQLFMKLKDGEVDPRFKGFVKKFRAIMAEEGLVFGKVNLMNFTEFMNSEKCAAIHIHDKDELVLTWKNIKDKD